MAGTEFSTIKTENAHVEDEDLFDAAWAQGTLQQAVDALMAEYHRTGKGDYFRVLHGRVCDRMTMPQIAEALGITTTAAENYYKASRKRLEAKLRDQVRAHTRRYCDAQSFDSEFSAQWDEVGQYLTEHGGLEKAIVKVYEGLDPAQATQRQTRAITQTLRQLTQPSQNA